ncbi:sarcinarray family MAST domain-containing protein [Methanolobus sp. ZRKC3]|uniref:sarcinarray family MAST domain-containing protein n=1 Tax=Methanolobus sp. ZRKC3 TaxID=3125786 RepID=UPI003249C454
MNKKLILCTLVFTLLLSTLGSASSSYLSINLYCNDVLYPDTSTPKPFVKIGEPFTLKFDLTSNQECQMVVELSDLGNGVGMENFVVINGPADLGKHYVKIYSENETYSNEWTLKATEEWAGGSMPINFYYSLLLPGEKEARSSGEFTAAYVTISNEYYDGPIAEPTSDQQSSTESPSTPAFTLLSACIALAAVSFYRTYR